MIWLSEGLTGDGGTDTTVIPLLCIFTPPLPRADCRNGVLLLNKVSADDDEFVTLYVVSDRMGERDCLIVIDRRDINASSQELVNERLVVVGTHAGPASVLHLGIENGY